MFLMNCIFWFVSLTVFASEIQSRNVQNVHHKRIKRLINFKNIEEISLEEHDRSYPYIVGIKTAQKKLTKKVRVRCTGTMLDPHLVLTTGLCVLNPSSIMVFKRDNPLERDMNDKGVSVELRLNASSLQNGSDLTGRRRLPNPLFYGNLLDSEYKWMNFEPMEENGRFPLRNLAILFLEEPLHPYKMNINYPVIEIDPGRFTRKNVQAEMFGWCQYDHGSTPKATPRLTKATVEVTLCEEGNNKSSATSFALCTNKEFNDGKLCELDQGGPVIVAGAKKSRRRRPPPPDGHDGASATNANRRRWWRQQPTDDAAAAVTLLALINRPGSSPGGPYGERLLYLWPYADWIASVREEYAATPAPAPTCDTDGWPDASTTDGTASSRTVRVDSYYDLDGHMTVYRKTVKSRCVESGAAAVASSARGALVLAVAYCCCRCRGTVYGGDDADVC